MTMRNDSRRTGLALVLQLFVLSSAWVTPAAAASSDTLPDNWTGLIILEWKSGVPDDSPLHEQIEHVSMEYEKRWHLNLAFKAENRGPVRVRYGCSWASVDYYQTSATFGKNGAVATNEIWKIEADSRILDRRQCNLVMVVDSETRKYWIEVGGFEIPDAHKTGQIVISITDENGTRSVSEPIDKESDIIEPIRFNGQYAVNRPLRLTGMFDAHVDPPAGVDLTHETLGGTIYWHLRRGACPEVRDRCIKEAEEEKTRCLEPIPETHDGLCADGFDLCLDIVSGAREPSFFPVHDCVEDYCTWELGTSEFDAAVNAYVHCLDEWSKSMDECDYLCP